MKEIIYVQAGTFANYTGTHFWDTQESYLSDDIAEHSFKHDRDVSFRETLGPTGHSTLCPRLLIFDRKANFGTLSSGADEDELPDDNFPLMWNGDVMEYRQDRTPESQYHTHIEPSGKGFDGASDADEIQTIDDIKYWSDFGRVYYLPRTVQALPDPGEWECIDGDWSLGQEQFLRFSEDTSLMDGSFRLFLEECDLLQGVQILNDTSSFGGFINSFIRAMRDESGKLPCLVFPLLSDAISRDKDVQNNQTTKKMINDALYLHSLYELSSMSVPIQAPSDWPSETWSHSPPMSRNSMYHNSAILSAHIESSTLPLRLAGTYEDISDMSAQLNWRGSTPFGELSGVLPKTSFTDFEDQIVNFSTVRERPNGFVFHQFARRDVTRGFSTSNLSEYNSWSARLSLQESFISRFHAPPYPVPTTYPLFIDRASSRRSTHPTRPCTLFSSIATSSSSATLFSTYAASMEMCLKRRPIAEAVGIDNDELKELANDLWSLHDNFTDGDGFRAGDNDAEFLGEDE